MRERIRSRNALFDIGASGPLAGMVVALPVLAYGLMHSPIAPNPSAGYAQEGQSLLYALMKRIFAGAIPAGSDVQMHPTAAAGWVGLLITMINLLPWGQLDGGHIAFALFGERQNKYARVVRTCLPLLVVYNLVTFAGPILRHQSAMPYAVAFANSAFWLVWYVVTGVMARFFGADHPPFEQGSLTARRRITAWLCLALFVVLFMPTPWAQY
jgi:membrane-associated protease RseP (regulator of RpoE activity)